MLIATTPIACFKEVLTLQQYFLTKDPFGLSLDIGIKSDLHIIINYNEVQFNRILSLGAKPL